MMNECIVEWSDVVGFEGLYQVSSDGKVKSVRRQVRNGSHAARPVAEKVLKGYLDKDGYVCMDLYKNSKRSKRKVHRLVCSAFVEGETSDRIFVNHKDGVKDNNVFSNLEWVTNRENLDHAIETNLTPKGEDHSQSKLNDVQVRKIKSILSESNRPTDAKIGEMFDVTGSAIYAIRSGKTWRHVEV